MKSTAMLILLSWSIILGGCQGLENFITPDDWDKPTMDSPEKPQLPPIVTQQPQKKLPEIKPPQVDPVIVAPDPGGIIITQQQMVRAGSFAGCGEIQGYIHQQLKIKREKFVELQAYNKKEQANHQERYYEYADSPVAATSAGAPKQSSTDETSVSDSAATGEESYTNTQEQGVDEADFVKIGGENIYVADGASIHVTQRETMKVLGQIDINGLLDVKLFADKNLLVVVGKRYESVAKPAAQLVSALKTSTSIPMRDDLMYHPSQKAVIEGRFYRVPTRDESNTDGSLLPQLVNTKAYQDDLIDLRFVAGRLVLVLRDVLQIDDPFGPSLIYGDQEIPQTIPEHPIQQSNETVTQVACKDIAKPIIQDFDYRLTKVISINAHAAKTDDYVAAILGGGDKIYMTDNALYVTKEEVHWFNNYWYMMEGDTVELNKLKEQLTISKFSFAPESGQVAVVAHGFVQGRIKDQWALKAYTTPQALSVITTTGQLWDHGENAARNHLWVLQQEQDELKVVAAINDFGKNEDVRSVRYVGHMAYVVTFKKTDPLFAFDLQNPLKPKLLGELKIPGFSVYMHPVGEGRMVGVGFDAQDMGSYALYQGIQVSLFDISDPMDMQRIDNKIHGSRGSYSDITSDHHAFFFDPQTNLMSIPVVELGNSKAGNVGGWGYGDQLKFSGTVLYQIEANGLNEVGRVSHQDLMPETCKLTLGQGQWWQDQTRSMDVNRVYKVDGQLLSISRFGIKVHEIVHPDAVSQIITFKISPQTCQINQQIYY